MQLHEIGCLVCMLHTLIISDSPFFHIQVKLNIVWSLLFDGLSHQLSALTYFTKGPITRREIGFSSQFR